jgi:hypothetical protein
LTSSFSNPANLPADCIPTTPPGQVGELGVVGELGALPDPNLSGRLVSAPGSLAAGPVAVPGITGKACGVVKLTNGSPPCPVSGEVILPADGQRFPTLKAAVTLIPGITPEVPFTPEPQQITGTLVCGNGTSTAGLTASVDAVVGGGAGLFGLTCVVMVHIALDGTANGPIFAAPGWYLGGTFRSSDFTIPAVTPTAACPPGVAANLNNIVGLPLTPGKATLVLPFALEVYTP